MNKERRKPRNTIFSRLCGTFQKTRRQRVTCTVRAQRSDSCSPVGCAIRLSRSWWLMIVRGSCCCCCYCCRCRHLDTASVFSLISRRLFSFFFSFFLFFFFLFSFFRFLGDSSASQPVDVPAWNTIFSRNLPATIPSPLNQNFLIFGSALP